jgi:hypothetical protein
MPLSRRAFFNLVVVAPLMRTIEPRVSHLIEANVAGFRFHDGPACERSLRIGQPLILRRERKNRHDAKAIAIHLPDGRKLGYVPRHLNERPAALLDAGRTLVARVTEVRLTPAPPWERVSFAMDLAR